MKTCLIVDDDALVARATRRLLERRGWRVRVVHDQLEPGALHDVQVALLDWHPHGPAALDLCRRRGIPCVIYTGAPDAALDCGAPVLAKPASTDEIDAALMDAVREHCGRCLDAIRNGLSVAFPWPSSVVRGGEDA